VKLCDFGLSTAITMDGAEFKTEYVVTRYYRAPEIILSAGAYDERIDVWGAACVVAEMILGGILFPSKSYMHQLDLMISLLGKPTDPELEFVRKPRALTYMKNLPPAERQPFHLVFPGASPGLLQLLEGCLQFSPDYRARVDQVLALELFNDVRSPAAEARARGPVHIEDIENTPLVRQDLLDMMLREGAAFTCYSNETAAAMTST
jgi:mitogen-activated protein kinase 1/3